MNRKKQNLSFEELEGMFPYLRGKLDYTHTDLGENGKPVNMLRATIESAVLLPAKKRIENPYLAVELLDNNRLSVLETKVDFTTENGNLVRSLKSQRAASPGIGSKLFDATDYHTKSRYELEKLHPKPAYAVVRDISTQSYHSPKFSVEIKRIDIKVYDLRR